MQQEYEGESVVAEEMLWKRYTTNSYGMAKCTADEAEGLLAGLVFPDCRSWQATGITPSGNCGRDNLL